MPDGALPLPIPLTEPPRRGEVFQRISSDGCLFIWESHRDPGFYFALSVCRGIGESQRRPIKWEGINATLRAMRVHLSDDDELRRITDDASWLERTRRLIVEPATGPQQ